MVPFLGNNLTIWRKTVKISARNTIKGKIKKVDHGSVNTEVTITLPGGTEMVSIITKQSAENLGLKKGKVAYAIIKASNVMIGVEE